MLLKSLYPKRIYQKIFILKKIPLQIFHLKLLLEIFWKSSFKYLIKWQFFLPFSLLWLVETLPFYSPPAWKKTPFGQSPPLAPPPLTPRKNHYRECPRGVDFPHSNEQWHRVEVRGKKIVLKGLPWPRSGAVVCSTLWNGCGKGLLRPRCRCYMGRFVAQDVWMWRQKTSAKYISKLKGS